MKKYLAGLCILAFLTGSVSAKEDEKAVKRKEEQRTGYMSYGIAMGYSDNSITKYDKGYYRNSYKTRTQGAFVNFSTDITFPLYGSAVVNSRADGLMIGAYLPFSFGVGKARGTSIDPFWLGLRFGGGMAGLYKVNDKLVFTLKEYWANCYENARNDGINSADAGLYTSLGVVYRKFYLSYAHNFSAMKSGRVKPLSVLNLKYNLRKGNGLEINTEYVMGKKDYKVSPADVSHIYPYKGYTITFGYTKVF
jgi:hypothetical protein